MKQLPVGPKLAGFKAQTPTPAVPAPGYSGSDAHLSYPLALPSPYAPSLASNRPKPRMPMSSFIALEYYCVRGRGTPVAALAWEAPPPCAVALPPLSIRAIIPRVEPYRKPPVRTKLPGEVLPISKTTQAGKRRNLAKYWPAAIAASVILFVSVWFGSRALNPPAEQAVNQDVLKDAANPGALAPAPARVNPVVWARNKIEKRAVVQITDTFKQGMAAWGVPNGWAKGWSRHPDGYVRPGQLALFQPTASFTDYRLEFFGEIEDRGMGWAIRARDPHNYYAMKLKVLAAGLRPVLAMVYYPVVGGKPGHKVEVPLSVMIHANTPYHVAVKVAGNRLTASVEGQEVESWTDEVESAGAVGFFTEPGERARLYWMKVFKNDDWLGRVCAFLSGNSTEGAVQTAWLNRFPLLLPMPGNRVPWRPEPAALVRERDDSSRRGPHEVRAASNERIRPWNS